MEASSSHLRNKSRSHAAPLASAKLPPVSARVANIRQNLCKMSVMATARPGSANILDLRAGDVANLYALGRTVGDWVPALSGLDKSHNLWQLHGTERLNHPVFTEHAQTPRGDLQRSTPPADIPHLTKTGRSSKAAMGNPVHRCDCGKSYTRAEHLRRHQQNHKPGYFPSEYERCERVFNRSDLLIRHKARHAVPKHNAPESDIIDTIYHGPLASQSFTGPDPSSIHRASKMASANDGAPPGYVRQDNYYVPVSSAEGVLNDGKVLYARHSPMANSSFLVNGGPAILPELAHHDMSRSRHLSTALKLERKICCNDQSLVDALRLL
jgi:hypothetical protein